MPSTRAMKGWPDGPAQTVADLPTPVLVCSAPALEHNVAAMAEWCAQHDVLLAPHGKTTMAPAVFARQLAAGAWGMTVATVQQAAVALEAGAGRIVIANQLATVADCAWVARRLRARPDLRILFLVDSEAGVDLAAAAGRADGVTLEALIEIGYDGGRCGVRDHDDAVALARRVADADGITLAGAEGFEGLMAEQGALTAVDRVDRFLTRLASAAERIAPFVDAEEPMLSAGGSAYFDRVVAKLRPTARSLGWRLVLRSGCYATHDHGLYAEAARRDRGTPRFDSALELRATVLSTPEAGRAIVGFGRRDVGHDAGWPVVLRVERADGGEVVSTHAMAIAALNDQHAFLDTPAGAEVRVGDTLVLGVSHPCTTLERWRAIPLVDRSSRVIDTLHTRF